MDPLPILALPGKVKYVQPVDKYCDKVMGLRARWLPAATPARVIESIRDAGIDQPLGLEPSYQRNATLGSRPASNVSGTLRILALSSEGVAVQAVRPLDIDASRCVIWLAHMDGSSVKIFKVNLVQHLP
jgi:hypothetical protein